MKTTTMVLSVVCLCSLQVVAAGMSAEDALRRQEYLVACLEEIQAGGVLVGEIYQDKGEGIRNGFAADFIGGVAEATVGCDVGWWRGWSAWLNEDGDELFYSQGIPTFLGPGRQMMPFGMTLSAYRAVRLELQGQPIPPGEDLWVNGTQAWRDGSVWQAWINRPWLLIGNTIEVVWSGHGGWRVPIDVGTFGDVIALNMGDMDDTLRSTTAVEIATFLGDDSYLEDGLIVYDGIDVSFELECLVVKIKQSFGGDIEKFTLVLAGYDEGQNQFVNYRTVCLKNVGPDIAVPLGTNIWIWPWTYLKVYVTDPRDGQTRFCELSCDELWYDLPPQPTTVIEN